MAPPYNSSQFAYELPSAINVGPWKPRTFSWVRIWLQTPYGWLNSSPSQPVSPCMLCTISHAEVYCCYCIYLNVFCWSSSFAAEHRDNISPPFGQNEPIIFAQSSKHDDGPPLFDAPEEEGDNDDNDSDRDWPLPPSPRDRDSRSGNDQLDDTRNHTADDGNRSSIKKKPRKRSPPVLRQSLFSTSPPRRQPLTATTAIPAAPRRSGRRINNDGTNDSYGRSGAVGGKEEKKQSTRRGVRARSGDILLKNYAPAEQMPPPPPQVESGRTPSVRDGRSGNSGGSGGERASASQAHGVHSGWQGRGDVEERGGLGLSAASVGSVEGELRGGELERVRGRVADLGAAIETSQV